MSWRVSIEDRVGVRRSTRVDCEAVVALAVSRGQAALMVRGANEGRLAQLAATLLVRLHEIEPAVLGTAIELIRQGKVATVGAAQQDGAPVDVRVRPPAEVGREVIDLMRFILDNPTDMEGG